MLTSFPLLHPSPHCTFLVSVLFVCSLSRNRSTEPKRGEGEGRPSLSREHYFPTAIHYYTTTTHEQKKSYIPPSPHTHTHTHSLNTARCLTFTSYNSQGFQFRDPVINTAAFSALSTIIKMPKGYSNPNASVYLLENIREQCQHGSSPLFSSNLSKRRHVDLLSQWQKN